MGLISNVLTFLFGGGRNVSYAKPLKYFGKIPRMGLLAAWNCNSRRWFNSVRSLTRPRRVRLIGSWTA